MEQEKRLVELQKPHRRNGTVDGNVRSNSIDENGPNSRKIVGRSRFGVAHGDDRRLRWGIERPERLGSLEIVARDWTRFWWTQKDPAAGSTRATRVAALA